MYKIDLRNGYFAVPYDAVTLNGMHLPQLNRENADYKGRLCLIMPDGKAAMGEDGRRPYIYKDLQECREGKADLHSVMTPAVKEPAIEDVMVEETTIINTLPLRLSVSPQAILDHFESNERVTGLPREQLLAIGEHVLSSDEFYQAFHNALRIAIEDIAGFDPE